MTFDSLMTFEKILLDDPMALEKLRDDPMILDKIVDDSDIEYICGMTLWPWKICWDDGLGKYCGMNYDPER